MCQLRCCQHKSFTFDKGYFKVKKKKYKKVKWFSEEALQIAEKRREAKDKGERERYTQLNAELQRIARRDKKTFLGEQNKETEENNRMGWHECKASLPTCRIEGIVASGIKTIFG